MFEKEEELLKESKERLEQVSIPEELVNAAIQEGYLKARHKKRKRQRISWTISVAAVLMLTFVTSIRVSPAFASAVANIPWLEPLVGMVQMDKGLEGIIDNEYYESIGISQSKDGYTFTLDGVIVDETGVELFYTMDTSTDKDVILFDKITLTSGEEDLLENSGYSHGPLRGEDNLGNLSVYFRGEKILASQDLILGITLDNAQKTSFNIPFSIKNDIKEGKVYPLNETVEISGQKIKIKEAIVSPLRVAITLEIDPQNDMEILTFENMRLEDEKGENWGSIRNGITAFGGAEDKERTFFLQSNYFREPKELYLKIDKVQALPKEQSYLLVDFEKQEVLNKWIDDQMEILNITSNTLEYQIKTAEANHIVSLFSSAIDATGKNVNIPSSWSSQMEDYVYVNTISFESEDFVNPVKLPFSYYPHYLEGSATLRIK